jgi:hypothetical protein
MISLLFASVVNAQAIYNYLDNQEALNGSKLCCVSGSCRWPSLAALDRTIFAFSVASPIRLHLLLWDFDSSECIALALRAALVLPGWLFVGIRCA